MYITARFERDYRSLLKRHPELAADYTAVVSILSTDPHNRTRKYPVKKLEQVAAAFTLIHELAHIVLRNGGVCDLHHTVSPRNEVDRVEVFCNRVAGAVLVPAEALRATGVVLHHGASVSWSDVEIGQLARRFWVSWEVVLRRLLIVGKTTKDFYDGWRNNRRDKYPERVDTGEPHLKMPVRVVRRHGRLFPKLVLEGYDEAVLTAHEAASYLNAGPEHLEDIRAEVFESKYAS